MNVQMYGKEMVTPDGNVDPFDDPAPPGTPDWRPFDWEDW